jgi:hypothetical protein
MVTLNRPVSGDLILSTDVSNIVAGILGDDGAGQLWRFHAVTDTDDYGAILGNQDTTNGLAARIQYGPIANPTVLADFTKDETRLNVGTAFKQLNAPSAPSTSGYTLIYPRTSDGRPAYRAFGGSETVLATAGEVPSGIVTTTGDMLYSSSGTTVSRLAIGTTNYSLQVVGGVPSWQPSPTSVLTTTGDLLYASGANTLARLAIGTARQALTVNTGANGFTYVASLQSLLSAAGSIVVASGANTPAELTIGTARQALTVNSGATGLTYVASLQSLMTAQGDIVQASAANTPARLAIGTARQQLAVNSGATALEYVASLQSLMTGTGDLVYSSGANTPARRAIGSTGDVLTVSGGVPVWSSPASSGLTKLDEKSGTGSSGTLSFTSISGSYRKLVCVVVGRSSAAVAAADVRLSFNGSSTAGEYVTQLVQSANTTVASAQAIGSVGYHTVGQMPGASSSANLYASIDIHVTEYANTGMYKAVRADQGGALNLTSGGVFTQTTSGAFAQTTAITQIDLTLSSGNWTTTSRATLYGWTA